MKFDHPHLVRIFNYCENKGGEAFEDLHPVNPFIIMELMKGKTLQSYIRNRPINEIGQFVVTREKLHFALQIVDALEYLWRYKLIHRDVKPANIFLSEELGNMRHQTAKLGDFGIVKWGDFHAALGTGTLTATHQKGLGTQKYMSPEQAITPKQVTVRSDIYSLGITLFELFTSQILQSHHHVTQIMFARLAKGNTVSRYHSMGYKIQLDDEPLAGFIMEMNRRGVSGRPTIRQAQGRLDFEYELRYGVDWKRDF